MCRIENLPPYTNTQILQSRILKKVLPVNNLIVRGLGFGVWGLGFGVWGLGVLNWVQKYWIL